MEEEIKFEADEAYGSKNQIERFSEFDYELAVAETFEEIKSIESKAAVLAELAKRNKYGFDEQNEWGLFRVEIEAKKGKWLDEHFPNGAKKGFNNREIVESNKTTLQTEGITKDESSNARVINNEPELRKQVIEAIIKSGKVVTPKIVGNEIKKIVKGQTLTDKKAEYILQSSANILIKPDVFLMDCKDFLRTFEDDSADLLLSDPPYMTDVPDIAKFTKSWLPIAIKKTKKTGRMLIFSGAYPKEMQAFLSVLSKQSKFILAPLLIWSYKNTLGVTPKMHHILNYQYIWHLYSKDSHELDGSITNDMFSVMEMNAPDGRLGNRFHTWQKPDELALRLIRQTSKEGDLVVDPFVCTGTFLIAASKLGRIGKGCDKNKENLEIAIKMGCQLKTKINNNENN